MANFWATIQSGRVPQATSPIATHQSVVVGANGLSKTTPINATGAQMPTTIFSAVVIGRFGNSGGSGSSLRFSTSSTETIAGQPHSLQVSVRASLGEAHSEQIHLYGTVIVLAFHCLAGFHGGLNCQPATQRRHSNRLPNSAQWSLPRAERPSTSGNPCCLHGHHAMDFRRLALLLWRSVPN